jgi:hypothetical protein
LLISLTFFPFYIKYHPFIPFLFDKRVYVCNYMNVSTSGGAMRHVSWINISAALGLLLFVQGVMKEANTKNEWWLVLSAVGFALVIPRAIRICRSLTDWLIAVRLPQRGVD